MNDKDIQCNYIKLRTIFIYLFLHARKTIFWGNVVIWRKCDERMVAPIMAYVDARNRLPGMTRIFRAIWVNSMYLGCVCLPTYVQKLWNWLCDSMKGRVRIRKSTSGEKWNDQLVDDVYGVLLYRCWTSKLCSCKCEILHHGCALKRERWASWAFLPKLMHFKDFKWIFYYKRTPALVILFQHINKYGNYSC